VLGQRTTYTLKPSYYCLAVAFVGGLFTLLAAGIALFVIAEKHADSSATAAPLKAHTMPIRALANKHPDNDAQADEMTYLQEVMLPARAELDNDLDNDGNLDGLDDPLVVALGLGLLVLPSVSGSFFLLSLYKLPMVGGDYCLPLERPG
jgi:hypothetical protein